MGHYNHDNNVSNLVREGDVLVVFSWENKFNKSPLIFNVIQYLKSTLMKELNDLSNYTNVKSYKSSHCRLKKTPSILVWRSPFKFQQI